MTGIFWRIIIAVVAVALIFMLIPPVIALIGVGVDPNVVIILRICVIGIALFYVLQGPSGWPWAKG